jgi:gentisate 1,2-dioxygenase
VAFVLQSKSILVRAEDLESHCVAGRELKYAAHSEGIIISGSTVAHNKVPSASNTIIVIDRYDQPIIGRITIVEAKRSTAVVVSSDRRGEDTGARSSPGVEPAVISISEHKSTKTPSTFLTFPYLSVWYRKRC